MKLTRDLARAVDLQVGLPDLFDPAGQLRVELRSYRAQLGLVTALCM